MLKSMTGYGSASLSADGKKYTVEIKSVNNRYSDFSVKMPRVYGFVEDAVKKTVGEIVKRGKVDIYIGIEDYAESGSEVKLNAGLADKYKKALEGLAEKAGIPCTIKAEDFLRIPDIFSVEKEDEDSDRITESVVKALKEAAESFDKMRIKEGARLKADLLEHLKEISTLTEKVEERAPHIVNEYREKITERIKNILGETPYDESRLLTEAAIFADRINVNEEIVRLKSHISQFEGLLNLSEPVGRKIDFLIQEMNREINTVGSKSNDLETARIVIDVKAEIEKLREQIQNIE